MRENINALLAQDYPNYEVFCITESADDPAAPVIGAIASKNNRLHHVVAGEATRCCQKNKNLLSGIDYAGQKGILGEIYAFADSDVRPACDWLCNLTLPLADERVFAVSGFRSLVPEHGGFSDHLHAVFSAFQALAMTDDNTAALWGGSMAVRREAFDANGVYAKWSRAVVDDMSLTWIARKHHLKRVFSSEAMVTSKRTFKEFGRVTAWLIRQTQFSAVYLPCQTAFALCLNAVLAISMLIIPVTLFLAFLSLISPTAAILHFLLCLSAAVSIASLGGFTTINGLKFKWLLYAPPILIIGTFVSGIGLFLRRLTWAKISYLFNRKGEVITVKRRPS